VRGTRGSGGGRAQVCRAFPHAPARGSGAPNTSRPPEPPPAHRRHRAGLVASPREVTSVNRHPPSANGGCHVRPGSSACAVGCPSKLALVVARPPPPAADQRERRPTGTSPCARASRAWPGRCPWRRRH